MRAHSVLLVAMWTSVSFLFAPMVQATEWTRWSFEESDQAETTSPEIVVRGKRTRPATDAFSREVPGAFIYDPLTKQSRTNDYSGHFHGNDRTSDALIATIRLENKSPRAYDLTFEAFVKPNEQAGGNTWLVGKSRKEATGGELALQWIYLNNANQTWHGAEVSHTQGASHRFQVGHYSSSTRLDRKNPAWRHVALTYDSTTHEVVCYVDYHLTHSYVAEGPILWDDGAFLIGGRPDHWGADALIDEVRVVNRVLTPAEFQRARNDSIEGVSFASGQSVVPRDAGCFDAKEHFGAAGDGKTDDTAALNAAFSHLADRVPLAYNTLVIPPGEYLVSDTLYCSRFIDVRGAGPEKTIIRLKDKTFRDRTDPQPVLRMSSTRGNPGSHPWVNGSSISLYLEGVTIDTGKENPGAKALEYHSNNLGRLENVLLRDGGEGVLGLDLTHHDVGPALVKNVRIEGFETGIAIRYQEYSMTLEHITLTGQSKVGIRNQGNILAIRKLMSDNHVTAIESVGANSMVTLLDSELMGGSTRFAAIQSEGGLYCSNVKTQGYRAAISTSLAASDQASANEVKLVEGPDIDEFIAGRVVQGKGKPSQLLRLPIEESPTPAEPPVSEWMNVMKFADRRVGDDWSPVIQAAVDSGAEVVYLPSNSRMSFRTPIRLHAPLRRLVGFGQGLNWASDVWKETGKRNQLQSELAPPPLLIFDEPRQDHVLVVDRLECVHLQHASAATLFLRSSTPDRYTTGIAGGKLFAEDIGGADWHFDHPQSVWVRQWNPESHESGPCVHSRGGTIWVLGFKTEYESQKWLAERGAASEILGGFIYPIGEIPADRPIFENRDSRMSLVYGASIYHANHKVHIRDTHDGKTTDYGSDQLNWAGSRAKMDLFTTSR